MGSEPAGDDSGFGDGDQRRDHQGVEVASELQQALGASQQNVSKHLAILHNAGMVARTKDGNHARYFDRRRERV